MTLEEAYLEHILLHFRSGDEDARPVRNYLDSWYAHSKGQSMFERNKRRPQWLNRGDIKSRPELVEFCHAVSEDADLAISQGTLDGLAKDHAMPVRQLVEELTNLKFSNRDELRTFLKCRYRVAIVTQEEHKMLGRADRARAKAPQLDIDMSDPFYRYRCPKFGIRFREINQD